MAADVFNPFVPSSAPEQAKPSTASTDQSHSAPLTGVEQVDIYDKVLEQLRTCYDPEIPVNIYELGLIYGVKVEPGREVVITMTLTTPHCPAAQSLPAEVKAKAEEVAGVDSARVDIVWEPIWDPSKMSEAARLQLGML
jgi:FeS assembly SUF system protein